MGGVREGGALLVGTGGEERTRLRCTPPLAAGGAVRVGPVERCGVTDRGGLTVRPVMTVPREFAPR